MKIIEGKAGFDAGGSVQVISVMETAKLGDNLIVTFDNWKAMGGHKYFENILLNAVVGVTCDIQKLTYLKAVFQRMCIRHSI